jgi:glycosyltransferase involved in cell wall biosynthesis
MTKILFIAANDWPDWGGSEILWSQAAEKLAARGIEVRASTRDWTEPIRELCALEAAGGQIHRRKMPSFLYRVARKFLPLPECARTHVRSLGKGVDLVVISQGSNLEGLVWLEEVRAAGLRYAVIAHSAAQFYWPEDERAERLAESYEKASRTYFVSEAILELTRRQFGTPLLGARVIRNPFNVSYQARPAWPSSDADQLSLACVARLDAGTKGQDLLLEVLSLPHWRERRVRVSLVGRGGNERILRRRTEHFKLTSVDFLGFQANIEEVWSKHHALILPSRQEGMPLALVEAMLCGRPGIVTDIGGSRELLRDGVNGFLADAPTVKALDEAMTRAWDSRHFLKEMGKAAAVDVRQWVSADPSEDFAHELISLVEGAKK